MSAPLTFNLTRDQFLARLAQVESAHGAVVTSTGTDAGDVKDQGCEVTYSYVEPTLTVTVVHKPFIVSESMVESKIQQWFAS